MPDKEFRVRRILNGVGIGLVALVVQSGCQSDRVPPPAPARVPGPGERRMSDAGETAKPLPAVRDDVPPPPFNDVPLVSQEAPEVPRYVEAYDKVGHPRIVVWVAHPPAGQAYDEVAARAIDYAALETILTDWLSAGGRVAVIAPEAARQALNPQQAQDLDTGHPAPSQQIGDRLKADVLVLVQAEPTRQNDNGPALRLVADASNLRGGESIGRAVVDVPPPLDKPQINKYTRFVARKLMADMSNSWTSFGGAPPAAAQPEPAPATNPPP
ncbi:MAG: hypothetical protein ACRDOD_21280, partial [Streptosporangiaceae bacterium]